MRIDPSIFEAKFPASCRLDVCKGHCCHRGGVWMDPGERDRIIAHATEIRPFLDDPELPAERWFGQARPDDDFPSGVAIESANIDGRCVFFSHRHFCAIQAAGRACVGDGWAWKPTYCILFPLCVEHGRLVVDGHLPQLWCMQPENRTTPVLDAVEREVRYVFGTWTAERIRHHPPVI